MALFFGTNLRNCSGMMLKTIHSFARKQHLGIFSPAKKMQLTATSISFCYTRCVCTAHPLLTNERTVTSLDEKKVLRNIRRACKSLNHVEALANFSRLQEVSSTIQSDTFNSLLHVTAHAGDEEGFDNVLSAARNLCVERDLVMQSNLVSGLSRLRRMEAALEVCREMEDNQQVPRKQALRALLEAATSSGNSAAVLQAFRFMRQGSHHPGQGCSVMLLKSLMPGQTLASEDDLALELLSLYADLSCEMEASVADHLLTWAEGNGKYSCTKTTMSPSVTCSSCGHAIERSEPALKDYLKLQHHIHYVLKKDIQSFLDQKKSIGEMIALEQLVTQEGSFQMVIDGLNVGYFQRKEFSIDRLIEVAVHCTERVGKVLVIARTHIQKHMERKGIVGNKDSVSCHRMVDHDVHFLYVRNRMIDDLFFVYATLVSSPDTYFLSNDQLGDITREFPTDLFNVFKRWQKLKQVSMVTEYRSSSGILIPTLSFPLPYLPMVQKTSSGRCWHIPVENSNTWLCLQQKD